MSGLQASRGGDRGKSDTTNTTDTEKGPRRMLPHAQAGFSGGQDPRGMDRTTAEHTTENKDGTSMDSLDETNTPRPATTTGARGGGNKPAQTQERQR